MWLDFYYIMGHSILKPPEKGKDGWFWLEYDLFWLIHYSTEIPSCERKSERQEGTSLMIKDAKMKETKQNIKN